MDKNYYDILQVNKNASPEIIEKAYKTLAKKYHPDLQPEPQKKQAEEILKEINEAYEVLSNPEKKKCYDNTLISKENIVSNNTKENPNPQTPKDHQTYHTKISKEEIIFRQQQMQKNLEQELEYQQRLEQARKKAYHDAYIQDLKNRGYKIRYKKSFKDYAKSLLALSITLLFLFLLWQIPFVKQYFINLYLENEIIRLFIDIILNLFK